MDAVIFPIAASTPCTPADTPIFTSDIIRTP
jgi:hypothetical protein